MGLRYSKWKIARTIWPYKEGWGVYRKDRITGGRIILDTGLTKEQAKQSAKQLNSAR